tara:strand:- start:6724 stop:6924 length:201 start_codon:yes stop_codon:yes gene_type:complete
MNAEDIATEIVNLTMVLDNQKELKDAWRVISQALSYLSSKDDFFTNEQRAIESIGEMRESRVESLA